jgi:hypothetical protein
MTLSRPHDPFSPHREALDTVSSPAAWRQHQVAITAGGLTVTKLDADGKPTLEAFTSAGPVTLTFEPHLFEPGPAVDAVIVDDPDSPAAKMTQPRQRRARAPRRRTQPKGKL